MVPKVAPQFKFKREKAEVKPEAEPETQAQSQTPEDNLPPSQPIPADTLIKAGWEPSQSVFARMGLYPELVMALREQGILEPTRVQHRAIPEIAASNNVLFADQTGSGKTLAFLLPIIHHMYKDIRQNSIPLRKGRPRCIILVPTRELAFQIRAEARKLALHCPFSSTTMVQSSGISNHVKNLKQGFDMLIGTPQRIVKLIRMGFLELTDCKHIVVDEADSIISEGFLEDLMFMKERSEHRYVRTQWVFTSATFTERMVEQIQSRFPDTKRIMTTNLHRKVPQTKVNMYDIKRKDKLQQLVEVLRAEQVKLGWVEQSDERPKETDVQPTIVFCNTVSSCCAVQHHLEERGFSTLAFHGNLPPKLRQRYWERFKSCDSASILVASDAAMRGLDTTFVEHVIMFDFPGTSRAFIHRIGRTSRAGTEGRVTALVGRKDRMFAASMINTLREGGDLAIHNQEKKRYRFLRLKRETMNDEETPENTSLEAFLPPKIALVDTDAPAEEKYTSPRLWWYTNSKNKEVGPRGINGRRVFYSVKKFYSRKLKDAKESEDRKQLLRKYMVPPHERESNPYFDNYYKGLKRKRKVLTGRRGKKSA